MQLQVNGRNVEADALIAFKQNLKDPDNMLQSWDDSVSDPCTYPLVICDQDNHVSELLLIRLRLSGYLVPQLGDLQYLIRVNLAENDLHGPIPLELGKLQNLKQLSLNDNNLEGTIPTSFGNLRSLRILTLQNNHLTGTVPKEVTNLPNLVLLNVSNNNIH